MRSLCLIFFPWLVLIMALSAQEDLSPEEIFQPDEYYEKVSENLYRSFYRLPPNIYPESSYSPNQPAPATPQQWLEKQDIDFGEGAYAKFDTETKILEVVQSLDQLAIIEAFVGTYTGAVSLLVSADVYELSAVEALELIDGLPRDEQHSKTRKAIVEKVATGSAKTIVSLTTTVRSGYRGKMEAIRGLLKWQSQLPEEEGDGKTVEEELPWGTIFEFDPVIGADNETVDLNIGFTFDSAKPTIIEKEEGTPEIVLYRNIIWSQIAFEQGNHILVGTWRPSGPGYEDKQVMHLLFVHAATVETGIASRVVKKSE